MGEAPDARAALAGIGRELGAHLNEGGVLAIALMRELVHGGAESVSDANSRLDRIAAIVARQLERAKDEGYIRPNVNSSLAATGFTGAFLFAILSMTQGKTPPSDELVNCLMEYVVCGTGSAGAQRSYLAS